MKRAKQRATYYGQLSRRQFTVLSASSFLSLMASSTGVAMAFPRFKPPELKRPKALGTTFSQLQCRYMNLDYRDVFRHTCALGFDRIRLCSYWNEIEPVEGQFDFTTLDWLLDESHKHGIDVVLTVGMKAPRWPEYHFPNWIKERHDITRNSEPLDHNPVIADRALRFIQTVINHARHAPSLKYWQLENEPFTRLEITGGRYLSYEFVRLEAEIARTYALPEQKLLMTNAISLPSANLDEDDHAFEESLALADAVGINVYTKVPINSFFYLEPRQPFWQKLQEWQQAIALNSKEDWIAEAQAEPWEPNQLVAMGKAEYPSSTPRRATTLVSSLSEIGYSTVMLWGCEYWYWQKKNGRNLWWWTMQQLAKAGSSQDAM